MEFGDAFLEMDPGGVDSEVERSVDSVDLVDSVEFFDVDDDGYSETRVSHTETGMTVARDRDGDGVIDAFTRIERGGGYESWEVFRAADGDSVWEQTAAGEAFG